MPSSGDSEAALQRPAERNTVNSVSMERNTVDKLAEMQLVVVLEIWLIVHDSERCVLALVKLPPSQLTGATVPRQTANFTAAHTPHTKGPPRGQLAKIATSRFCFLSHCRTFRMFSKR